MEQIFVCQVCGHIEFGQAPDACPVCWAPKEKFEQKSDAINPAEKEGKEKHVPVIVTTGTCGLIPDVCQDVHVKVGVTPHPMEADHWIKWIDVYMDKKFISRTYLNPAVLQAAVGLHVKKDQKGKLTAIELCNKHGYWMSEAQL